MVVAEVPLWVRHKSAADDAIGPAAGGASSSAAVGGGSPPFLDGLGGVESDATKARKTAELWNPSSSGRCPVYSIDCHSSYFCTAGGDGTVKVWQLDGLFPGLLVDGGEVPAPRGKEDEQHSDDKDSDDDDDKEKDRRRKPTSRHHHHRHPHVGHIDESGGYVSPEDDARVGEPSRNGDDTAVSRRDGKGTKNGDRRLVVSEEDNDESDSRSSRSSTSSSASSSSNSLNGSTSQLTVNVHDLTGAVRKKSQGGASAVASPPRVATGPPVPSPLSSPSRQHHNHQHRHRLVTTLSGHSGSSVLAVRFSHHGKYVATGGDDGLVLIYRTTIVGATSTSNDENNAEESSRPAGHGGPFKDSNATDAASVVYWPRIHMGTGGHSLDVVDLCWSPDDSLLVSCSVDSRRPVIVWKLPSAHDHHSSLHLSPYKVLSPIHHTSTVRGVTFDPAGSYLATSGDDPAICVWRAHDDWGLEKRITDIFYKTPADAQAHNSANDGVPPPPPPPTYHHDPTFVRRLSWSTDGLYIACTNALVKNRHVASTVARQGWSTAGNSSGGSPSRTGGGGGSTGPGGATLVGHKQPVVASRHCPRLLRHSTDPDDGSDDNDNEAQLPKYSTLLALGDKAGFVTVWTTRQSRPVFKLQCASRTTVTDLAWSTDRKGHIILLVSQLDGAITALLFGNHELPSLLSPRMEARFFALKYGLEVGSTAGWVGAGSLTQQSQFIESALTLVHREEEEEEDHDEEMADGGPPPGDDDDDMDLDDTPLPRAPPEPAPAQQEVTTTSGGKKRVRPVLLAVGGAAPSTNKAEVQRLAAAAAEAAKKKKSKSADPIQHALEAAEKASAAASAAAPNVPDVPNEAVSPARSPVRRQPPNPPVHPQGSVAPSPIVAATSSAAQAIAIPHSTSRLLTVDLQVPVNVDPFDDAQVPTSMVAECSNAIKVPSGSTGEAVPCTDIIIRKAGQVMWRDQLLGTHACEVAASLSFLAVGTTDGTSYLYGNSPSVGWTSGQAFRSHPPLVIGSPIVRLRLQETQRSGSVDRMVEMLVVASDGSLAVYELFPSLKVQFKASVLPAMNHMALSSQGDRQRLPDLSRIQFTKRSGRLLLLLAYNGQEKKPNSTARTTQGSSIRDAGVAAVPKCVGGSIQGFVYDRSLELWMRVSDSRFVLSDFYSGLPSKSKGELSRIDDLVRSGSVTSSLRLGHRGRDNGLSGSALFRPEEGGLAHYLMSRSHCEDRMSCALVLKSTEEFKHWLGLYARTLALSGSSDSIRLLVDMILRGKGPTDPMECAWWLSAAPTILGLDRKSLVKSTVLPELRKNLALQRVANEISLLV